MKLIRSQLTKADRKNEPSVSFPIWLAIEWYAEDVDEIISDCLGIPFEQYYEINYPRVRRHKVSLCLE